MVPCKLYLLVHLHVHFHVHLHDRGMFHHVQKAA
jgi:hypothetical protein